MISNYKEIDDIRVHQLNNYLLILIMTDYIFTYIGINYLNVITEANPLLISFFNLPFSISFFLRLAYATLLVSMSKFLYEKKYRHYKLFLYFSLSVNIFVTILHLRWGVMVIMGLN